MSGVRVALRSLVGTALLAGLAIVAMTPVRAEDTCVADAPHDANAIRGHTWSGTVAQIEKRGVDYGGVERWIVEFVVDRVYAHNPEREFPKDAILAAGARFALPSDNCGRRGDMGLIVGARYLVSAGFVAGEGTALGNVAIWTLDGERASIVPGLYQTSFASSDITGVRTLGEALDLIGIAEPQPTELTPTAPATAAALDWSLPLAGLAVFAVIIGGVAFGLRGRRTKMATRDIQQR